MQTAAVMPIPLGNEKVRCPKCNEIRRDNRNLYRKCGVRFLHE